MHYLRISLRKLLYGMYLNGGREEKIEYIMKTNKNKWL